MFIEIFPSGCLYSLDSLRISLTSCCFLWHTFYHLQSWRKFNRRLFPKREKRARERERERERERVGSRENESLWQNCVSVYHTLVDNMTLFTIYFDIQTARTESRENFMMRILPSARLEGWIFACSLYLQGTSAPGEYPYKDDTTHTHTHP